MGEIGGGDDKIVAEFVDHMRQFVVEGAEDKHALGEPTVDLGSSASPNAADFWPAVFPSSRQAPNFDFVCLFPQLG